MILTMTEQLLKKNNFNFPPEVKKLIDFLSTKDLHLIGGFVRDMVLGVPSFDLDFVIIDKSTKEFGEELLSKFEGHYFLLDKDTQTTRFVLKDEDSKQYTFDFTSVKSSDVEEDFKRRDFTINALAINLKEQEKIIDKFNGLNDIKQKNIKAISLENFKDDPLRVVRAFRFATLINGEIDKETLLFIKERKKNNLSLDKVSPERISVELWKILDCKNSFKYIKQMSDIGLLEEIFPEITPMREVPPNSHHHLWLYDHSVELIKTFEDNFHKIPEWAQEELNKPLGNALSPTKKAIVKLACLFHDIGKPNTWEIKQVNGEEKHTFYGHDKVGEELTKKISDKLKFSNLMANAISKMVRYHLRPFQLSQGDAPITERALYRFFRDVGEETPMLLMLAMADLHATLGPKITKDDVMKSEKLVLFLFDEYKEFQVKQTEDKKKKKLLDGNEIIEITGLEPSPKLGEIVSKLDEAIAIGEVKTKEEAKKWVLKAVS